MKLAGKTKYLWLALSLVAALGIAAAAVQVRQAPPAPPVSKVHVVKRLPHDRNAFTQGLLFHQGKFYESTGLYGQSSLRRVDPETGTVEAQVDLAPEYFGEGLALVDKRLIQITWRENTALVYDLETFEQVDQFTYEGEGWGIDFDGERLVMSNGSNFLTFRDPVTFEVLGSVAVTHAGRPLMSLNELECYGGFVYANLWMRDEIAKIDPNSGQVVEMINAVGLLSDAEREGTDVLNGIAVDRETGSFYLTGKKWPALFEVKFQPVGEGE